MFDELKDILSGGENTEVSSIFSGFVVMLKEILIAILPMIGLEFLVQYLEPTTEA